MKSTTISAQVLAIATAVTAAPKPSSRKSTSASVAKPAVAAKNTTPVVKAGGAATKSTSASVLHNTGKPGVGTKTAPTGAPGGAGEGGLAAAAGSVRRKVMACTNRNAANGKIATSAGDSNSAATPAGLGAGAKTPSVADKNVMNSKTNTASMSGQPAPTANAGGPQAIVTPIPKSTSAKGNSPKPTSSTKPKRWANSVASPLNAF